MNFRDYASKMRSQAADAVSKLPTFDDMAATDDYIHSEDFNVRGQPKPKRTTDDCPAEAAPRIGPLDPDETSSTSSWSLLDRPMRGPSSYETGSVVGAIVESDTTSVAQSTQSSNITDSPPEQVTRSQIIKKRSTGSLPLLSVVADALTDQEADSTDDDLRNGSAVLYSDSDDDSLDDDDEEDPILSMIRQSKPQKPKIKSARTKSPSRPLTIYPSKPTATSAVKNKSSRFMDDLDSRLATPEDRMEQGVGQQQVFAGAASTTNNPFGNWVKTFASTQVTRLMKLPDQQKSATLQSPPPLARQRPQNAPTIRPEEDFHMAVSSSVLADDEMAQLARLKQSGGKMSMLMDFYKDNRHFLFIVFTLVLAAFVYFYSRKQVEDDVQ